jgi:RNA polymerase sigma-70 factor (ECF subfamily)
LEMMMPDDQALLTALRARSPDAFRLLFDMYSDRMFRLAVGMLGGEDEAEDIVQDVFLRFFEKLDAFEGRSQVGTWLYRAVHNASVDRLRRRRPTLALSDEPESDAEETATADALVLADWSQVPESFFDSAEAQAELDLAIGRLPESLRAVFLLRDVEGLSTEETAGVLDISISAAKVRLHRARLQLRQHLSAYFGERLEAT